MPDTPLNPDALEAAKRTFALTNPSRLCAYEDLPEKRQQQIHSQISQTVEAYLAVAQPEVSGEQVNLAGWTCNGIHEPGDYSTCEECRDACDDLARFYNHMMRNPRPFKHWTGSPEVKP